MTKPNFGAQTDHFGILAIDIGGGVLMSTILSLIESSAKPVEQSRADAPDDNADVADSTYFGNTAGELYEVSSSFVLKSGSLSLALLKLGELTPGTVADSLEVDTKGGASPVLKFSGKIGLETIVAPTGKLNTFTLPALTVVARRSAQLLGFTIGAGGRLTGCKLAAKIKLDEDTDGAGEPIVHGVSGGIGTITAEFVRITDVPTWTLTLAGLTQMSPPGGGEEPQADHHTFSASAGFTLTRDAA